MSQAPSHSSVLALLVVLAAVSVQHVTGYYYYYYQYPQQTYYTTPQLCQNVAIYGPVRACPVSSCYCAQTRRRCCLNVFQARDGQYYQQCICDAGLTCASTTPYDTASTVATPVATRITATTPTTTSPTTTPTTTSTTTTPTTTSTTTTATTTPPFRSLCSSGFRILNGGAANECDFNGVAKVTQNDGKIVSCNAVYAPATVNGQTKMTFITTEFCADLVTEVSADTGTVFDIEIGTKRYPIDAPLFTFVKGPSGTAFIDINSRYSALLTDLGCHNGACPYDQTRMNGKVDLNDCKIASYGASDANTLLSNGLKEARLMQNPGGCTNIPDLVGAANTMCFKTVSGSNLVCSGDNGAPVYCKAPSNGEWILVGVAVWQNECDSTSELKVIPYPG